MAANIQMTNLLPTPPPPPQRVRYPDYSQDEAYAAPWKYTGYRVFSKWVASDQAFFIVRRFGALNTRVILALQDEIAQLDQSLNALDEEYSRKARDDGTNNGSFRFDPSDERRELVQKILPEKLLKYNKFINEYSKLVARPDVSLDDIEKVKAWFEDVHPYAIEHNESQFIARKDDLIAVQPKRKSRFRHFLESTPLLRIPVIRNVFDREPDDFNIIKDSETIWHNDKKVERFSSVVVAIVGLAMLTGPLWILEYVNGAAIRLGVITGFIAVFFVLVSVATTARIFDALVAAAAYSAVLMVFLQIGHA